MRQFFISISVNSFTFLSENAICSIAVTVNFLISQLNLWGFVGDPFSKKFIDQQFPLQYFFAEQILHSEGIWDFGAKEFFEIN